MESKKISADEARALQIQMRLKKFRDGEEPPPPPPPPPLAAPVPLEAFLQPGNLATKAILDNGLNLEIRPWPRVAPDDDVYLYINNVPGLQPLFEVPNPLPPTPYKFPFKLENYQFGSYKGQVEVRYQVVSGSAQKDMSEALIIKIDREPPNKNNIPVSLLFPPNMNNKITTKYLEENNDQVIVTVPAYDEMEAGQTVILWWNSRKTTAIPAVVVTAQHVTDQKIPIVIPGAQFTALPDSRVYLQYNLVSRVGYEGPPSEMAYVDVSLQPEPTNLQDPIVPLAADGLIDLDDANAGVEIQILAYTNIVNGDSVVAYWGSSSLSPEMVSANEFPVFVSVPRAIVLKEGSGTIQVRYEVQRGASVTQSSSIPVTVDVSTVGPVDPVPDTNVNEALQPPSIRGGSNKNAVNTLLADDKGKAATAIIPFYQSGRGNPAAPIITEEGAVIELIWGEMPNKPIPLGAYTISAADLAAKTFPPIQIPASIVDATADTDDFEVHYTVSRPSTKPPKNSIYSPSAKVVVDMDTPGGPDGLLAPTIMGTTAKNWITKETIIAGGGVKIRVAPYAGMKVGDTVKLLWVAFKTTNNATDSEIPGTEYDQSMTVTEVLMANGMEFTVPYSPYVDTIAAVTGNQRQGSASAKYIVDQKGNKYTSKIATVKVELSSPSGN